ncbi:unnamed protein product [Urochloa humidicola]
MAGQQPPPDVVFRIGDELTFISFMMRLRQRLANHTEEAERTDIMGTHHDPDLNTTQTHPLLPRQRLLDQPLRWIRIKLEVDEMTSTTLVMRDDNLYVHGFMNGKGAWYEVLEHRDSKSMLPLAEFNPHFTITRWGLGYPGLLGVVRRGTWYEKHCAVAEKLENEICSSGKAFAVNAARTLCSFPDRYSDQWYMDPKVALAGLFVIVSESARMTPLHDAIACGWNRRHWKGFTKQLMLNYVWSYGAMSRRLRNWKEGNYTEENRVPDLLDTYLVLNWLHRQ